MTYKERLAEENDKVIARKIAKAVRFTPTGIDKVLVKVSGAGELAAAQRRGAQIEQLPQTGVWQSWVPQYRVSFSRSRLDTPQSTSV